MKTLLEGQWRLAWLNTWLLRSAKAMAETVDQSTGKSITIWAYRGKAVSNMKLLVVLVPSMALQPTSQHGSPGPERVSWMCRPRQAHVMASPWLRQPHPKVRKHWGGHMSAHSSGSLMSHSRPYPSHLSRSVITIFPLFVFHLKYDAQQVATSFNHI